MEYQEGFHTYYVYILTNKAKTVLYTGLQII
jgi:putative endonuclease